MIEREERCCCEHSVDWPIIISLGAKNGVQILNIACAKDEAKTFEARKYD
jgi:hypothetical protein